MIKRAPRAPRHKNRLPAGYVPTLPAVQWVATIVATKARFTCNIPVSIDGIPASIEDQGQPATSIAQVSAQVFDVGFAAAVIPTDVLHVPAGVVEVKGVAGGTLAAGDYTFP